MPDVIRVTEEEHKKAIETADGMGALFSRMFALMITAFWKGAFPVLERILLDAVPNTMTISDFIARHPELEDSPEFKQAMQEVKRADPNVTMRDLLERAFQQVKGATDGNRLDG